MEFEKYDFFKNHKTLYAEAKEGLRGNYKNAILINLFYWLSKAFFFAGLTLMIVFFLNINTNTYLVLGLVFLGVSLLTYGPMKISMAKNTINMVEDTEPSKKDFLYGFKVRYFRNVWYSIVLIFRYLFFLILLIFPFFIKYLDYSVSSFILASDEKMSVDNALKISSQITKGRKENLIKLILSFSLKYLLSIVTLYIYSLFARPQYNATLYCFYKDIKD